MRVDRVSSFLFGAAIATVAAYYFDPVSGRRRRALIRDQVTHLRAELRHRVGRKSRDLRNRTLGLIHVH